MTGGHPAFRTRQLPSSHPLLPASTKEFYTRTLDDEHFAAIGRQVLAYDKTTTKHKEDYFRTMANVMLIRTWCLMCPTAWSFHLLSQPYSLQLFWPSASSKVWITDRPVHSPQEPQGPQGQVCTKKSPIKKQSPMRETSGSKSARGALTSTPKMVFLNTTILSLV